jgi:hypothetical protein
MSEPNTRRFDRLQPARIGEMLPDWMMGRAVAGVNLRACIRSSLPGPEP